MKVSEIKIGKLISCMVSIEGENVPGVVKKVANRADGHIDTKIVIPRRFAGRYMLILGDQKTEPEDIIIKHKGFKLL